MKKDLKRVNLSLQADEISVGTQLVSGEGHVVFITKIYKNGKIDIGDDEYSKYGSYNSKEDLLSKYTILKKPIEEYEKELIENISSDFSAYDESQESTSTDLMLSSGADQALTAQKAMKGITEKLAVLDAIMNKKRSELRSIMHDYEKKLKNITKVVSILELYLGINEEVTQIREGDPALIDEPITLRQLVLHMDEEVGSTKDNGIDFHSVHEFDEWLLKPKNLQQVLPEKKGIVILRPRRNEKDYRIEDNPIANALLNENNFITYVLIRNGDNLYRIYSGNLHIYPHLFPSEKEMSKLNEEGVHSWDQEKNDNRLLGYKRNALFIQSLIDRTDIFKPHKPNINIFHPETYEGNIKFVFDGDGLGDGKLSFKQWQENLNKQLKRGDRLYFTGFPYWLFGKDSYGEIDRRFPIAGWTHRPDSGVYNIKRVEDVDRYGDKDISFICQHKPEEEIYVRGKGYSERKMSTPFRLYPDDEFILNYELMTVEDIDYYLTNRLERKNYLSMMPVLRGIKEKLLEEKRWEDGFIKLAQSKMKNRTAEEIKEAIAWWKTKVIEKRPLTKEDTKALNMILERLKRS